MSNIKTQMQDGKGNIIHPETDSSNVTHKEGNIETVINDLEKREETFVQATNPKKRGFWVNTKNSLSEAENNTVVDRLKKYVDGKIGILSNLLTTKKDNIVEAINENTTQLKDCAKQTDLDNYYSLVNATKIATGTDILTLPFGNYVSVESEITETLVNCPTKGSGFVMKVERTTGGIQGNFKRLTIKCNNITSDTFINTLVDTQWSGWKQLATVDDSGWITLPLEGKAIAYESYQTPIYRKINNTVEIIGAIKDVTNFNTNNNVIFATLPTGFRSKKDFRILCQGSNKDSWLLTVTESGMLKGSRYGMNGLASSMDGTEWLPFHVVFTV